MFLWHKNANISVAVIFAMLNFSLKLYKCASAKKERALFIKWKICINLAKYMQQINDQNSRTQIQKDDMIMIFCAWVQLGFLSPCDSSLSPNNIWKSMFKEPILEIARSNNVSENPHDWFSGNGPGRFWSPVDSPSWKVSGCCPGLDRAQESTGGRARQHCQRFDQSEQSRRSPDPLDQSEAGVCRPMGVEVVWRQHHRSQDSRRRKLQFLRFQIHKNTNTNK